MQFLVCLWFKDPVSTSDYMLSNGRITDKLLRTTPSISRNIPGKTKQKKKTKNIGSISDLVEFRTSRLLHMESNTFYSKFGEYHNHLSTQDGTEKHRVMKHAVKAKNVTVWSPAVRNVLSKKTQQIRPALRWKSRHPIPTAKIARREMKPSI